MEPWGTPVLTEYSCEDFPSKTTRVVKMKPVKY